METTATDLQGRVHEAMRVGDPRDTVKSVPLTKPTQGMR